MNFLFFGLGSIGQRHLRNLLKLEKNCKIFALRKKFSSPLLNSKNEKINGDIETKYKILSIKDLNYLKENKIKIDATFICNPSSMHVASAKWCINRNIPVFIEKPVATNIKDLRSINQLIKSKKRLVNVVGYQLRFNPIINYIKNYCFNKKKLGHIFNCEIFHGEHVDSFHNYESYKNSYTSQKKLGGGVALTQIHEIDYLNYFFSEFKLLKFNYLSHKISDLKLNVEDNYISIFKYKSKINKKVSLAKITCSYVHLPKTRTIFISCELGTLIADLNKSLIQILKPNKKKIIKKFNLNRNIMFYHEMKYFLNLIKKKKIIKSKKLPSIPQDKLTNQIAIKIKI